MSDLQEAGNPEVRHHCAAHSLIHGDYARRSGRPPRLRSLLACLLGAGAVTVAVAACGSGTLTHAQLVSRAATACRAAESSAAKLPAPGNSYASLARYARQLSPIVRQLIGKLTALKPNASDRQKLNRYVAALRTGNRGLGLLSAAGDSAQASQASSVITSVSVPALARRLGVPACAASPGS